MVRYILNPENEVLYITSREFRTYISAILDLCKLVELPEVDISATKLNLLDHMRGREGEREEKVRKRREREGRRKGGERKGATWRGTGRVVSVPTFISLQINHCLRLTTND